MLETFRLIKNLIQSKPLFGKPFPGVEQCIKDFYNSKGIYLDEYPKTLPLTEEVHNKIIEHHKRSQQ
jgi:hypothetical protein